MMIQKIRTSKVTKVVASYLAIQLILQIAQPTALWALTGGPKQPEFTSFTPIGTSDMVNLASGDFNYNIPIMDVGGYPLNLAYNSGVTMDQEASWVGLGWNLNVGQINRQVRGIPDDFKGDPMVYENNLRDNVTVSVGANFDPQIFGLEVPDQVNIGLGLNLKYNNYTGLSFSPSYGLSFDISDNVTVGMNVQTSAQEGATISPNVSLKGGLGEKLGNAFDGSLNAGVSYNSTQGLSAINLSASVQQNLFYGGGYFKSTLENGLGSGSGSISFSNVTMTPRKRTAFKDINGTLAVSVGPDAWGFDGELEVSASGSVQKIKDVNKTEKAYGYEFTGYATPNDILDYNREHDQPISKTTLALPTTNYTYDLYSVQGQGLNGMFRPYRSQIGQINDEFVKDESAGYSLGVEIEGLTAFHTGVNFTSSPSKSHTGIWNTDALRFFKQGKEHLKKGDYEPVYFKYIGEPRVDRDYNMFEKLGGYAPAALDIVGDSFGKQATTQFNVKEYRTEIGPNGEPVGSPIHVPLPTFNSKFERAHRDVRNQSVQKISKSELKNFYAKTYYEQRVNPFAKPHHTAEIRVLKPDGATYVFGETAYNTNKEEVTFAVNGAGANCQTGEVPYAPGSDNSTRNRQGRDNFFNRVQTPAFAHSYLLSSVLSADYEDLTGNGPTDDDLGAYTLFEYEQKEANYKWRIPYNRNMASYNAGLNTDEGDQTGSYIYGEKELKYINKITTKTHIAVFELSKREDGRGVAGENGGGNSSSGYMQKLDRISLYSKPEYEALGDEALPIKVAHFAYDYSLCPGAQNNLTSGGKLTLKQVYFTYRDSKMGQYTPYKFSYSDFNPAYGLKSYDVWGNYKPNMGGCNTQDAITVPEYPFVEQSSKETQDERASAWSLTGIDLPSGGHIDLEYESDDYQFVQDRAAMQMFKVAGAGRQNTDGTDVNRDRLYKIEGNKDATYLYVELPEQENLTVSELTSKYFKNINGKPIYFRFLLNMTKKGYKNTSSRDYDYVTGYFELNGDPKTFIGADEKIYAAIPMLLKDMEGGIQGEKDINPINKAGLYFARKYLNAQALGLNADYRTENIETIAKNVIQSFAAVKDIFSGPNKKLRGNSFSCARRFIPSKSWIRLSAPKDKLGGGCRVKKLEMHDQWDAMLGVPKDDRNHKMYGQEYAYTLEDGSTSGVATFEPNGSKENPFVEPFYNDGERLIAPKEISYVEKPFGAAFFPAPKVTYGRVTVTNLQRDEIEKHATGKVVSEFFTSKDFPTIVDHTDIDSPSNMATNENAVLKNMLKGVLGLPIWTKTEYTLSQGYVIHTNDMDGKMRMQKVYAENAKEPLSSVKYTYNTQEGNPNILSNKLPVIAKDGVVSEGTIGVDYDVVTDFRESYSKSDTKGGKGNLVLLFIPFIPFVVTVPSVFPTSIEHENIAHSVITTKVIHTSAIIKEKVATDLGATVTTRNEAWDATTGEILLTKTVNEYNDQYYNFNFPAYWAYENMAQASKNIGITGVLRHTGSGYYQYTDGDVKSHFALGDELMASYGSKPERLWVVGFNEDSSRLLLMNRRGQVVNRSTSKTEGDTALQIDEDIKFKIIRSGYRNQQMANMGAVTMMDNPLRKDEQGNYLPLVETSFSQSESTPNDQSLRIVNASAVGYSDFWNCQCERGLPSIPFETPTSDDLADLAIEDYLFNPYLFNVHGDWRAEKSYAYLTERSDVKQTVTNKQNSRKQGYFKEFTPYYNLGVGGQWQMASNTEDKWTFASEVTQYSPYGAEVENKDALNRFSSAQYGYNMTLPTAVTSNSRYRYMGADNFEDYNYIGTVNQNDFNYIKEGEVAEAHFNFKKAADEDGTTGRHIAISEETSHTGLTSLVVPNNKEATLKRPLRGQLPKDLDSDKDGFPDINDLCPYTPGPNGDYDGDKVGDICDDDAVPTIINKNTGTGQQWYRIKEAYFTIKGKPNDTIRYATELTIRENGAHLRVNGVELPLNRTIREVVLDITGQADMKFYVQALQPSRKKYSNRRILGIFELLHKKTDDPITGESLRLCPVSCWSYDEFNQDKGGNERNTWHCDKFR